MSPRPPLPFGLGTDLCRISRIASLISKPQPPSSVSPHHGRFVLSSLGIGFGIGTNTDRSGQADPPLDRRRLDLFLRRIFSTRERLGFSIRWNTPPGGTGPDIHRRLRSQPDPSVSALATFLAGRWAAKEAVIKAATGIYPSRRIRLHQVLLSSRPGKVRCMVLDDGCEDPIEAAVGRRVATADQTSELSPSSSSSSFSTRQGHNNRRSFSTGVLAQLREGHTHLADGSLESIAETSDLIEDWSRLGGQEGLVSISHDSDYATASAMIAAPIFASTWNGTNPVRSV